MSARPAKQLLLAVIAVVMVFVSCACALSTFMSQLDITPTAFTTSTPEPTQTNTSTPTTTATFTPLPTSTPTATPSPTPSPTATPCSQGAGTVQRVEVPSAELGKDLPVSIYLPACYSPNGNYPVLYLLHGQSQTDQLWINLGVTTIADDAIRSGATPFIMVFPYEEYNYQDNKTSKYPDAIVNDLIPWVDGNYATCTERICRSIGGISRGGGWAVKLAMHHFDLFGTLGGHSYGLMYGDKEMVKTLLQSYTVEDFPRIYLDRGELDGLAYDIELYVNTLIAYDIPYEYHVYPGSHNINYWSAHVQEYMQFYMASWPAPFVSQP